MCCSSTNHAPPTCEVAVYPSSAVRTKYPRASMPVASPTAVTRSKADWHVALTRTLGPWRGAAPVRQTCLLQSQPVNPTRYIALLRAINVGGRTVKMQRLREVFTGLGLDDVRSYINSGNLFFDTYEADRAALTARIEAALHDALGYNVPVFLRTVDELQAVVDSDAFSATELTDELRFCVVFTAEPIWQGLVLPWTSPKNDLHVVAVTEREAFVIWHIINGRPPSGKLPADVLPEQNTSRFFHTLKKILAAARG